MSDGIKYVHTNIIADNWKLLVDFYVEVFECKPILPERDLSGKWIEDITGIDDVRIRGMHLELPGYIDGPTLEIFQYTPEDDKKTVGKINAKGLGHLAFHVDSVEQILAKVIECGGSKLGELIKREYDGIGVLTVVYASDPEGNFIELQNWSK